MLPPNSSQGSPIILSTRTSIHDSSQNVLCIAKAAFLFLLLLLASTASASTLSVPGGGDLQSALNAAQCGDTVILQAGATYQATGDQGFVFPAKAQCSGTAADMITVRTSNLA